MCPYGPTPEDWNKMTKQRVKIHWRQPPPNGAWEERVETFEPGKSFVMMLANGGGTIEVTMEASDEPSTVTVPTLPTGPLTPELIETARQICREAGLELIDPSAGHCPVCDQEICEEAMAEHIEERHPENRQDEPPVEPYPCQFCGATFRKVDARSMHETACPVRGGVNRGGD